MTNLGTLPKIVSKRKKRIGRGLGSGKGGHTVGRGTKGQKAREKIAISFFGTKMKKSLIKRLPLQRGKGKLKARGKPIIVNLEYLNLIPKGSLVDEEVLAKAGIVKLEDAKKFGVKILGRGKLSHSLTIAVPISRSAAKKVIKARGKIKK